MFKNEKIIVVVVGVVLLVGGKEFYDRYEVKDGYKDV